MSYFSEIARLRTEVGVDFVRTEDDNVEYAQRYLYELFDSAFAMMLGILNPPIIPRIYMAVQSDTGAGETMLRFYSFNDHDKSTDEAYNGDFYELYDNGQAARDALNAAALSFVHKMNRSANITVLDKSLRMGPHSIYVWFSYSKSDDHLENQVIYGFFLDHLIEKIKECPVMKSENSSLSAQNDFRRAKNYFQNTYVLNDIARTSLSAFMGFELAKYFSNSDLQEIAYLSGLELYSLLHSISTTYVEQHPCTGNLIFIKQDDATVDIPLDMPLNKKLLRKYLSLSSIDKGVALLCDGKRLFGLGKPKNKVLAIIQIVFTDHGCWKVLVDEKIIAQVRYGDITLHQPCHKSRIKRELNDMFGDKLTPIEKKNMSEIVYQAVKCNCGTTLIFLDDCEKEVERLSDRGSPTHVDLKANSDVLEYMLKIDGAIMMNFQCVCSAIGMILDGTVKSDHERDRSRGARFNSAITYINGTNPRALAVIISEDGDVDYRYNM